MVDHDRLKQALDQLREVLSLPYDLDVGGKEPLYGGVNYQILQLLNELEYIDDNDLEKYARYYVG